MSIKFKQVSHTYSEGTPFSYAALKNVDLEIPLGKTIAIIGQTGSGKSTLVQHLNALLTPTQGEIEILGRHIVANEKTSDLKNLRKKVGLVFQFPEYQLFEDTVEKDIAFGPMNFNTSEEKAMKKAKEMLNLVGLDDSYLQRSPFDLSGGQKRRVAIAGILALDPEVLVLDEPTAGLDPQGAKEMMSLFKYLNKDKQKSVLLVTHDMEHVLEYCDEVIVMKDGKVAKQSDVQSFFSSLDLLNELKINPPRVIALREALKAKGYYLDETILTIEDLAKEVAKEVKKNG